MVSGKVPRLSFLQLMNMLQVEQKGKLGRVFVNYGRVINLREYLKNISLPKITHENLDDAALRVSEKLYKEQQHMTAANLSQIVSCVLLFEQGKRLDLDYIQKAATLVFTYLKKRKVNATMTLNPTQDAISLVVKQLGFKVKNVESAAKGKKTMQEVFLDAREDQKTLLSLAYYANIILMSFILDFCVCYILNREFTQTKSIHIDKLIEQVHEVYSVLRYEFIEKLKQRPIPESIKARVRDLAEFGEITVVDG